MRLAQERRGLDLMSLEPAGRRRVTRFEAPDHHLAQQLCDPGVFGRKGRKGWGRVLRTRKILPAEHRQVTAYDTTCGCRCAKDPERYGVLDAGECHAFSICKNSGSGLFTRLFRHLDAPDRRRRIAPGRSLLQCSKHIVVGKVQTLRRTENMRFLGRGFAERPDRDPAGLCIVDLDKGMAVGPIGSAEPSSRRRWACTSWIATARLGDGLVLRLMKGQREEEESMHIPLFVALAMWRMRPRVGTRGTPGYGALRLMRS